LGNSHGFDKNGSTSGYVLWVNGRGIMIDPPPYSSNALEKEGIHPQMIFGVMITHCHADHDAGAFQKVLTGSRLSIITTPSIYSSFIRKYSALSGLTPSLLRQSHRFRAAIIGTPLKFQGATFHFTYTLHTIPCISFKVEWRGRSMVFTGDHLNLPPLLDELEEKVSKRNCKTYTCKTTFTWSHLQRIVSHNDVFLLFHCIFIGSFIERPSRLATADAAAGLRRLATRSGRPTHPHTSPCPSGPSGQRQATSVRSSLFCHPCRLGSTRRACWNSSNDSPG